MIVQLLHVYVGDWLPVSTSRNDGRVKVVLFCANEDGNTVAIHVDGWRPYAFLQMARCPEHQWNPSNIATAVESLGGAQCQPETVTRTTLFDFQLDYANRRRAQTTWFKIRFDSVKALRGSKRKLLSLRKKAINAGRTDRTDGAPEQFLKDVAEHTVSPSTKFLDEIGIAPCGWIELPDVAARAAGSYSVTHATQEFICPAGAITPVEREVNAPFVIASVDIECRQGADGSFPRPEHNPIICIGTVLSRAGAGKETTRIVHAMRECDPIDGAEVHDGFTSELDMLDAWRDRLVASDAVVIIGYNLWGFDYRYMVTRYNVCIQGAHGTHEHLPISKDGWCQSPSTKSRFPQLSMFKGEMAVARPKTLSSAAMGFNELFEISATGRITLDLLLYMKTNYKLSRYTLNAVAAEFIGDQKQEITHEDIYNYYDGTPAQRSEYCRYCIQDCALPTQLCTQLAIVEDYVQSAKVQWTQLADLVSRGQQIRVFNMLHHYAHLQGYVIDREPQRADQNTPAEDEGYEGATVLSPTAGFYKNPIATLDFASLYPSIMRAHNLCYTTLWATSRQPPPWLQTETFEGVTFVVDKRFRGVLPCMLDNLLQERKATKKLMATETDPRTRAMLDKKQQAQKVSANSVYGFTGAVSKGMYPCKDVARITTARGRDYIAQTRTIVEEKYHRDVIYGDTDSVMVSMRDEPMVSVFEKAEAMGEYISSQFPSEIVLEFEKVYQPYLLKGKKRYVGCKYEGDPAAQPKMDCKGIEMVRRDNATLARDVQKLALTKLIMEDDPDGAVEAIRAVLAAVVSDTTPFQDYVITKGLAESYKNTNLVHVRVAQSMEERGTPVPTGGRVEFVILRRKGCKLFERGEDATYAKRNRLMLDRLYYADKQIVTPLRNLFGAVFDMSALFDAALGAIERQNTMHDRAVAAQRLNVTFRGRASTPPTLRVEAAIVTGQLQSTSQLPAKKKPRTIESFFTTTK